MSYLSTKEHAKLFCQAFIYPNTIKPFPKQKNNHNEQENDRYLFKQPIGS